MNPQYEEFCLHRVRRWIREMSKLIHGLDLYNANHPRQRPLDFEEERVALWKLKRCLAAAEAGQEGTARRLYAEVVELICERKKEMP
jgi:hypothetical protein